MSQLYTALLTVEQTKTTWCPEARTVSADGEEGVADVTVNRRAWGEPDVGAMCLGDGCAFWRWHDRGARPQPTLARVNATWVEDQFIGHSAAGQVMEGGGWTGKPDDGRDWHLDEDAREWYVPGPSLPPRG